MTTLVTGGAGYIGSHVVRRLRDRDEPVVVLDRLSTGHAAAVPADVPLVRGDVRDVDLVLGLLAERGVDAVVHLAGEKSVARAMAAPAETFEVNVGGTLALLHAMASGGVSQLVFSSSCAVYGTPDRLPIDESTPVRPDNPYGESKAIAERLIGWFARVHGLRAVVFRYFNAAGADSSGDLGEDWEGADNLVPSVLHAAWTGEPVSIFGADYPTPDGSAVRDFVHVADLADAHGLALDHLRAGGAAQTLNLGTGAGTSVLGVIGAAREITGRPIRTFAAPRRSGDPAEVWADASRAAAELGWRPRRDVHDMLASAWAWHRRHPGGFERSRELDRRAKPPEAWRRRLGDVAARSAAGGATG